MQIMRNGDTPSAKGSADWFTGNVRIDQPFDRPEPSRLTGATVTFEPGARTAWHSHPLGQTLIVVSGVGWTRCADGERTEVRAGDFIWCPPGHRHWHGATSTTAMSHIAVQEKLDGVNVTWMEQVDEADYLAAPAATR